MFDSVFFPMYTSVYLISNPRLDKFMYTITELSKMWDCAISDNISLPFVLVSILMEFPSHSFQFVHFQLNRIARGSPKCSRNFSNIYFLYPDGRKKKKVYKRLPNFDKL